MEFTAIMVCRRVGWLNDLHRTLLRGGVAERRPLVKAGRYVDRLERIRHPFGDVHSLEGKRSVVRPLIKIFKAFRYLWLKLKTFPCTDVCCWGF